MYKFCVTDGFVVPETEGKCVNQQIQNIDQRCERDFYVIVMIVIFMDLSSHNMICKTFKSDDR